MDWQLDCTDVKKRSAYLFLSGQWSDCTFLVGDESNQIVVVGHKLILAMASPVFEVMFYGSMAESNEIIPIVDVETDAFKALLEYIYTDNIIISSFEKACELYYGAKKYMLTHLVKVCCTYLLSKVNVTNACRGYELARLFEEKDLMEKCIKVISTKTKEVLKDSSFKDLDLNTVLSVFSFDRLNVDSELDLFEAAERYAKEMEKKNVAKPTLLTEGPFVSAPSSITTQDKEQVVNIDNSGKSSPEAITETCNKEEPGIRNLVEKIRFLTLTPLQFATGPARSMLLSESDAYALLMNIVSPSIVLLPPGFSSSRVPRRKV